jgi:hypothetical protein
VLGATALAVAQAALAAAFRRILPAGAVGIGMPAGAGTHSPIRSAWLQLTQAPVQATLQQTPSAQKPLSQ